MTDLRPYPEYKDSTATIPWAEDIPIHWDVKRIKALFQKMDRPVRDTDEVITCFRDGAVMLRKNRRTGGFTNSLKEIGYQGIRKGDLVIHQMDAFAGAVGVSDSDGKGTPVYSVCQPFEGANQYYYAFIVREMARTQWISALATGIRERSTDFRYNTFSNQFVPLPPPDEQAAIVTFLDAAEARIRRYIRAKQKLIKLLNEQKQTIIQQAVTRGLDPDVPMKDSGIEWLGEIPAHWEVKRLKSITKIRYGLGQPPKEKENGLPLIRATNISRGKISETNMLFVDPDDVPKTRNAFLNEDEIIVVRSGAYTADSTIIPSKYKGAVTGYDMVVTVTTQYPKFISYALLAKYVLYDQLITASLRAAQPHLNASELGEASMILPTIEEQIYIAKHIELELSEIDTTIDLQKRNIDLIREYRTRLIADVVTGKVDVRRVAFEMPEAFDESDLLDVDEDELFDEDVFDGELEEGDA